MPTQLANIPQKCHLSWQKRRRNDNSNAKKAGKMASLMPKKRHKWH